MYITLKLYIMNSLKALIPDFRKADSQEPKNKVLLILCGIMVACVFLPWIRYSTLETGGKVDDIVSANVLGITTWYGIVGLITALIAAVGVYLNQYALTFWSCLAGAVFGLIGVTSYADIKFDDYIIFKEDFEAYVRAGNGTGVNHIGAKLFLLTSCLLAGFSFVKIFSAKEKKEETTLSKITLGLAAFVCAVIVVDAMIIRPTFVSYIATNILAWGLPTALIVLLAYGYFVNGKEGKSNKLNMYATVLFVIAFLFTNPIATQNKSYFDYGQYDDIRYFHKLDVRSYDDRDDKREIKEKEEDAFDDGMERKKPQEDVEKRKRNRNRYYDDNDYDW